MRTSIKAKEGYILTNGEIFGTEIFLAEGMSAEEAHQESSRCLRCDHFGYGSFKGGRETEW